MITDYGHIHNQIMKPDPSIRLVTICTNDGQIMYSDHREGVKNLLTQDESKRSLELAVNAWKVRSELSHKIGKGKVHIGRVRTTKTDYNAVE